MTEQELQEFSPSTPTEMALMHELQKTRHQLQLMKSRYPDPYVLSDMPPLGMGMQNLPPRIELVPEARLIANIEDDGRMRVEVKGYYDNDDYPKQIGKAYYVDLRPETVMGAVNVMALMHKRMLHELAEFGWRHTSLPTSKREMK